MILRYRRISPNDNGVITIAAQAVEGSINIQSFSLRANTVLKPFILQHPVSQIAVKGSSATFTVAADGLSPLTYQWRSRGVDIVGATASSLTIDSVTLADAGGYNVVVSNSKGLKRSHFARLVVRDPLPMPDISLTESLDQVDLQWSTSGDSLWFSQTDTSQQF